MTDNSENFGQFKGSLTDKDYSFIDKSSTDTQASGSDLNSEKCIDLTAFMSTTSDPATIVRGTVVARGTGEGLVLRLDGRVPRASLFSSLVEYVESRKSFFSGQDVTLEWLESRPAEGILAEVSALLQTRYQMIVKASRMFERNSKSGHSEHLPAFDKAENKQMPDSYDEFVLAQKESPARETTARESTARESTGLRPVALNTNFEQSKWQTEPTSLFAGINNLGSSGFNNLGSSGSNNLGSSGSLSASTLARGSVVKANSNLFQGKIDMQGFNASDSKGAVSEALLWDEPDARIIRETLRGGQKIESEHSVIIKGDVNSGAEIVAGGDIFVMGRLRGVAHAGAYDESGAGRMIFALQMQPTQLRIGSIISQGSDENGRIPEIAKIEGNMIVVEPYGISSSISGSKKTGR